METSPYGFDDEITVSSHRDVVDEGDGIGFEQEFDHIQDRNHIEIVVGTVVAIVTVVFASAIVVVAIAIVVVAVVLDPFVL